jgi:tetratricopeptide (TPR) repeat protein
VEPAFRYSLAAGREALRLAAVSDAIVHFEKARQLARETSFVSPESEPNVRDLYVQLGRAYELGGQHKQALAVYDELARLTPKQSWQNN